MNHELLIIAIPFLCGAIVGAIAALITASALMRGKSADLEKQAWASASRYYEMKAREQRKQQLNQSI